MEKHVQVQSAFPLFETFRLDAALRDKLLDAAKATGRTRGEVLRQLLTRMDVVPGADVRLSPVEGGSR